MAPNDAAPPLIMVVDREAAALAGTVDVLRRAGYRVTDVDSFHDAKSLLATLDQDLLIADIRLGAFNGLHLVFHRQAQQPGGPSIVTNAYADPVLEQQARKFNAPYLVKPVAADKLLGVVTRMLRVLARPTETRTTGSGR